MPSGVYKRKPCSEETKKKISLAKIGKKFSKEHKENMSKSRKGKFCRENHPNWKGGRKSERGYFLILKPEHPFSDSLGYIRRSRFVMEQIIGRYLKTEEVVHHKNKIVDDDKPDNLRLFKNNSEHQKYHHPKGSGYFKTS